MLRLCIIDTENGDLWHVAEDLQDYDLSKPFARASVANDVERELVMIRNAKCGKNLVGSE